MKKLFLTLSTIAFITACQHNQELQPEKQVIQSNNDNKKFCIYDGHQYSKGSIINVNGTTLQCHTYSVNIFDETLSWGKVIK